MLVALLSTLEPAGEGASCPKGFLVVAGRTVVSRQAELALALGCERVICLARGVSPELVEVQHMVEHAGRRFHIVRDQAGLMALTEEGDHVLGLAGGLLPAEDTLRAATGEAEVVLSIPAEEGAGAGYERLDRDWCWAGVLRCTGSEVGRLAELPHDVDALSALMRCTLQAGHPMVPLPDWALASGGWLKVDGASSVEEAGRQVLSRNFVSARWSAPGNALIDRLTAAHAEQMLRRSAWRASLLAAATLAFAGAFAATRIDGPGWALLALAVASGALRALAVLDRIRNGAVSARRWLGEAPIVAIDLALLALIALETGSSGPGMGLFSLLVLLGGLHLCRMAPSEPVRHLGEERVALLLILSIAAAAGHAGLAGQVAALLLMAVLFATLRRDRITRA